MTTMVIAQNETRESGSFMGDQLCSLKAAYLFIENQPDVDRVIMSVSPANEMHFLWTKFIERYNIELVWDEWNPGDWAARWAAWDMWRAERRIQLESGEYAHIDHYRELYLRIHGCQRQHLLCGSERGLGRRNIYEYWLAGQENAPDAWTGTDWFDDTLIHHPPHKPVRDVYISPHAKTQGNLTFTFDFWSNVVHRLVNADVTVTVGYNGWFCEELNGHPNYRKHWGDHGEWMQQVCGHKLVACGNTGTGWLAAACGVPMITMEPHNSCMADHRFRECGLRNIVEVVDGAKLDELNMDMGRVAEYVADRIIEEVRRCVVMTTGCYDILHAGHVRHLQRARAMGTRLIVALNSDQSVRSLKGEERPINPQDQRKTVLEALRCVDEVQIFDGPNAIPLIEEIRPDVLVCGHGYTPDTIVGRDVVKSYGGRVAVSCSGDARNDTTDFTSTTKIINRIRHSDVAEALRYAAPFSINPVEKLRIVANEFVTVAYLPGDVADLGAWRGGVSLMLRKLAPEKHIHLFDTWQGNPYNEDDCHHKKGEWATPLEDCRLLVGNTKTYYHPGIFPFSWPLYIENEEDDLSFCFVYVDMDLYQSTCDAISFFWHRLIPGGKMVFDDYGWEPCAGVKRAVDMFLPQGSIRVIENTYTCVVTKP